MRKAVHRIGRALFMRRHVIAMALLVCILLPLCTGSRPRAQSAGSVSWSGALDQEPGWYAGAEAIRIADNLLLHQHDNGGWLKNIDMAAVPSEADRRRLLKERAEGGTTIDNGASHTQIRYLARVYEATGQERFEQGVLRGLDFLLDAQYDNGGWPQYYPIREGYYEHITFNDGAMIEVMQLLRDVAHQRGPYRFVDPARRRRAADAVDKGLDVILKAQIEVEGRLTAWCAQHDRYDLRPQGARTYELASLSGAESVGIVRYLMEIEEPGPEIVRAVESAVQWLERVKLTGITVTERKDAALPRGYDLLVVPDPSASALWARFYDIRTNRPMFVGRDGIVRDALADIEYERRVGYRWLGDWARDLLEREYPAWRKRAAR